MIITRPTVQFVYTPGVGSYLISLKGGAKLSHVDAVLDDGSLLGARFDNPGGHGSGVKIRPPNYEKWSFAVRYTCVDATAEQHGAWKRFLFEQLNKDYDWSAILAFAMDRDWHDPNKWICSEYQAAAAESGTLMEKLYEGVNKVDPAMFACAVSAAGWIQS